ASRVLSVSRLANAIDVTPLLNGADVNLGVDPSTLGGIALSLDNAQPEAVGGTSVLTAIVEGAAPRGMVTFFDGEKVIGSAAVNDNKAVLVMNMLSVGTHSFRVAYSGDTWRPATVSKAIRKVIAPAITTAVLTHTSPSYRDYGSFDLNTPIVAPLTLSMMLAAQPSWLPLPTGNVIFYNGNDILGESKVVDGRAQLTLNSWPAGMSSIRAVYSGDAWHIGTSIQHILQESPPSPRQLTLSASSTSVRQGDSVILTAQLDRYGTSAKGFITFFTGTTFLGAAEVNGGVATLTVNCLPMGSNVALSATFASLDDVQPTPLVAAQGPSIQVAASSNPVTQPPVVPTFEYPDNGEGRGVNLSYHGRDESFPGEQLILTDLQFFGSGSPSDFGFGNGPWPKGTVSVFSGQAVLGSFTVSQWYNAGAVSLLLREGEHDLTLVYSGVLEGSSLPRYTSAVRTIQHVIASTEPERPGVVLAASRPQPVAGTPVTLTATLAHDNEIYPRQGTSPVVGGTVTFSSRNKETGALTSLGTATLVNGVATLTLSTLPKGTNTISIRYSGDGYYSGSYPEAALALQVGTAPIVSAVTLESSATKYLYNQPVVLTATSAGINNPEGGSVSFYEGATLLGNAALVKGQASLSVNGLKTGQHTIKAVYSGDANNITATSLTITLAVGNPPAVLTNLTTPTIAQDGGLSVRVAGQTPTGLVSFYSGTTLLGTVAVREDGTATLRGVPIPAGTHTFSAVYSGDSLNADGA
ncbi:Ig-like domain-containing protein, partial [Variovorax sp. PDC80]|uniref:Ig-like domain-containing protein n=1 Tax=Variovorax sp. PDC80 TaxID=1882827 RepID=UPI00116059CF